jgi:hypothetical protein
MKISKFINFLTNMCQSCQGITVYEIICLSYCVLFFIIWHETLLHSYVTNLCGTNLACVNPKNVTSQRDNHAFGDLGLHIIVLISLSYHMQYTSNLLPKEPLLALTCHVVFNKYAMYICINQMSKFFHFKHCRPIWSLWQHAW